MDVLINMLIRLILNRNFDLSFLSHVVSY